MTLTHTQIEQSRSRLIAEGFTEVSPAVRVHDELLEVVGRESGTLRDSLTVIRCDLERRFQASDYVRDGFNEPEDGRVLATIICLDVMEHHRRIHERIEKLLSSMEGEAP